MTFLATLLIALLAVFVLVLIAFAVGKFVAKVFIQGEGPPIRVLRMVPVTADTRADTITLRMTFFLTNPAGEDHLRKTIAWARGGSLACAIGA